MPVSKMTPEEKRKLFGKGLIAFGVKRSDMLGSPSAGESMAETQPRDKLPKDGAAKDEEPKV